MEVKLIDVLGNDLNIVNSARVSYNMKKSTLDSSDIKLLTYLAKNEHTSPFRHGIITFHVKCPEFVARQMYKHVVGANFTSTDPVKDHGWNEMSQRYREVRDFYTPTEWRRQSSNSKQGSDNELVPESEYVGRIYSEALSNSIDAYRKLLDMGVAKEQARMILPLSCYTEFYWTASFQAIMNFIKLRTAADAQCEIRIIAGKIADITRKCFPYSYDAWVLQWNKNN